MIKFWYTFFFFVIPYNFDEDWLLSDFFILDYFVFIIQ